MIMVSIVAILLAMLVTWCLVYLANKYPILQKLYESLRQKLFYNSLARFCMQSYFKLSLQACVAMQGFTGESLPETVTITTLTLFALSFPVFSTFFLVFNRKSLFSPTFQVRFNSLYLNVNQEKYSIY